jgi:hypothetical protein
MAKEKTTICKTKGCNNPILDGKYCEYCKQKRKEKGNIAKGAVAAVGIPAAGYAIKKGALKQVPKIAKAALQIILRK